MFSCKRLVLFVIFLVFCYSCAAWAINFPYPDKAKIRLFITPGETKYGEITLENPTPEAKSMRAYLEDWQYVPPGDGPKEFLPPKTSKFSCVPWIVFSPSEFTIPPFGKQKISYSLKVPPEAKGGYYAAMFFEGKLRQGASGDEKNMEVGIDVALRIASLFYVEAKGTTRRAVVLTGLALERKSKNSPLSLSLNFKNTGNVDITTSGTFHIINKAGMVYARGELSQLYTFPGDRGILKAEWKEPLAAGKYDLIITLDLGKALQETGMGKGPVITKEAEIEIGSNGGVLRVGSLK